MSNRPFDVQGAAGTTTRRAAIALCMSAALVWLAGGSAPGQAAQTGGAGDKLTIYSARTGKELPTVRGTPPPGRPTHAWTGAFLPDGQPDLPEGVWESSIGAPHYLDRAESGSKGTMIVDPPDGTIPYQSWARDLIKPMAYNLVNPTKPWHVDLHARCIGGYPRMFWYVSPWKIHQTPGYVVFRFMELRVYKIVPLDGRPHIGKDLKLYYGDSVGRWDGNTLIVDTTNLNPLEKLSSFAGDFITSNAHLTEKFVFEPGDDRMMYEVTIDDAKVFTRPWTVRTYGEIAKNSEKATNGEFWEYQCDAGEDTGKRPASLPGTEPESGRR